MIPGIVSAQTEETGGAPAYAGNVIALDFVNGLYFVGETAYALGEVIDKPSFVTGGTLELRFANETTQGSGVPNIIGDALAAIVGNPAFTFVIDWAETETSFTSIVFSMQDGSGNPSFSFHNVFQMQRSGGGFPSPYIQDQKIIDSPSSNTLRDINSGVEVPIGRHRAAITRTNAKLIASIDGEAVEDAADGSIPALAVDTASFGSKSGDYLFNEIDINSLVVYAPVDDAELPGLSTL